MSVLCYQNNMLAFNQTHTHQVRYDQDIEEKNVYLSGSIDHHLVGRAQGRRRWVGL